MQPLSLLELSEKIESVITDTFPFSVPVVAEISEMNVNRNGHCYIELIEQKNEKIVARIRGIIYANRYTLIQSYFSSVTGTSLQVGLKVFVMVRLSYHNLYGLNVEINDIDPKYTLGDLEQQRQIILERLSADGVLDMNRSLPLPIILKKIAIISSATAAGYGDFVEQLNNNPYQFVFSLSLFEAYMQGEQAAKSIQEAIDKVFLSETEYDIIVIIRGGGSKSELFVFDNYNLAYLITQLPIPVLTGIGHDRDFSVCDHVANQGLKTPTAVADFIINHNVTAKATLNELLLRLKTASKEIFYSEKANIENLQFSLKESVQKNFLINQNQLEASKNRLLFATKDFFNKHNLMFVLMKKQMEKSVAVFFSQQQLALEISKQKLSSSTKNYFNHHNQKLNEAEKTLELYSPQNILNRGYALVTSNNKKITNASQLQSGDSVKVYLKEGLFQAEVTDKQDS